MRVEEVLRAAAAAAAVGATKAEVRPRRAADARRATRERYIFVYRRVVSVWCCERFDG